MPITSINIYTLRQVRQRTGWFEIDECSIDNPRECYKVLQLLLDLKSEPVEKFGIVALNSKNHIAGVHIIAKGALNHNFIEAREVYQAALINNAHAIIAFHNHPSGNPRPSIEDVMLTRKLKKVGELIKVALLDHIVTGEDSYVSLKEEGVI